MKWINTINYWINLKNEKYKKSLKSLKWITIIIMYLSFTLNRRMAIMYICAYHSDTTNLEFRIIRSLYFEVYNNKVKKKWKCSNLCKRVQWVIFTLMAVTVCVCVSYMNCSNTEAWLSDCGGGRNIGLCKITVLRVGYTSTNRIAVGGVGDH